MGNRHMKRCSISLIIRERKKVKLFSRVLLLATPWTVAYQAPASMGFSKQEYWSGLRFPSPGDLPNPGIELRSPALQADTLPSEPPGNNQGDAYQNCNEISPHTCQNHYYQKMTNKCCRECGGKGSFVHCQWECNCWWFNHCGNQLWQFLKKLKV